MVLLERSIIMILLLTGLLNARPRLNGLAKLGIAAVVLLAFVAPAVPLPLPGAWFPAVIIPLLLWQSAYRLANARWPVRRRDIFLWIAIACAIGFVLAAVSNIHWPEALLFGVLSASILWRAVEEDEAPPSHLGQVGMLALAFLLAEIAPFVESPQRYVLGLAGGAALGALVGYLSVHVAREWARGKWRGACSVAQAYAAYGIALTFGLSGVAAAALGIAVHVAYGTQRGLWPDGIVRPQPMNARPVFIAAVAVLAFFGWQMHLPMTPVLMLETFLGLVIAALGVLLAKRFGSMGFVDSRGYLHALVAVLLQLLPALLLWPRDMHLGPVPLEIALLLAFSLTVGAKVALTPLLKAYGLLDQTDTEIKQPDYLAGGTLVKEVMTGDIAEVRPDTPASEIVRLLTEGTLRCIPVVEEDGRLAGLVTERDLFLKRQRLPRARLSYASLFREPVQPEQLPEVYAEIVARNTAADIMNRQTVSVNEDHNIRHAIRIMAEYGYDSLPVLCAAPEAKGKLAGILTRRDIIRAFSKETRRQ